MPTVEGLKAWEGKFFAMLRIVQTFQQAVLRLRADRGDDVQILAHQVHGSRGIHGNPRDVLEQVEAYLGSTSSNLNDALKLLLLGD